MIQPISISQPIKPISFQGGRKYRKPDLKQLWDKGKLPTVKYGFYGDILTKENISREHLLPASLGGTTKFGNIVLASKEKNQIRSNYDIRDFADAQIVKQYLQQFNPIHLKEFDGKTYIQAIKKTLKTLGMPIK